MKNSVTRSTPPWREPPILSHKAANDAPRYQCARCPSLPSRAFTPGVQAATERGARLPLSQRPDVLYQQCVCQETPTGRSLGSDDVPYLTGLQPRTMQAPTATPAMARNHPRPVERAHRA